MLEQENHIEKSYERLQMKIEEVRIFALGIVWEIASKKSSSKQNKYEQ